MESCPAQAVLPLVGLAADKVVRDSRSSSACRRLIPTGCWRRGKPREYRISSKEFRMIKLGRTRINTGER
ncbi:MAG: hypothetical protein R6U98_16305 [Pirellulaceae bacterium]